MGDPPPPGACTCALDSLFNGQGDGFVIRYDGNYVLMNDFPTTGGPWIPAINTNGQTVWINGAGL